ncbi:nuclear transport factor 2 family protein [Rhizobiaceae bacterium n13]|uniref:Nuclear transport factor 2 family protein n=1 Tax=Ferirhizobium litorale TaxID=2927786 RepID=A0AAE3QCI3_9HYPH|nr:nuclear transport factor 2 family protein [Fererhizobium litorale]MDI7860554.1 nuclear transport factor 2 family protein [Fererhizobium litorale]MDI7920689.1 nuclear transport factor 2 family protein [Fererhizobium litorale]
MTTSAETVAIRAVLDAVCQGHQDKDAAAIGKQFTTNAVIFDLAPPLAHRFDLPALSGWLDNWMGPISLENHDFTIEVSGDLAFCHGFSKVSATTKVGGERAERWQRTSICLRRIDGIWKIVHEHTSVPFHMDGSYRAAIDLDPGFLSSS